MVGDIVHPVAGGIVDAPDAEAIAFGDEGGDSDARALARKGVGLGDDFASARRRGRRRCHHYRRYGLGNREGLGIHIEAQFVFHLRLAGNELRVGGLRADIGDFAESDSLFALDFLACIVIDHHLHAAHFVPFADVDEVLAVVDGKLVIVIIVVDDFRRVVAHQYGKGHALDHIDEHILGSLHIVGHAQGLGLVSFLRTQVVYANRDGGDILWKGGRGDSAAAAALLELDDFAAHGVACGDELDVRAEVLFARRGIVGIAVEDFVLRLRELREEESVNALERHAVYASRVRDFIEDEPFRLADWRGKCRRGGYPRRKYDGKLFHGFEVFLCLVDLVG